MRREEVILQKLMAEGEVIKAVEKFIRAGGNPIMIKETVRHTIERMKMPPASSVPEGDTQ
tara:strand:+ start:1158 stop:1337 length:180 start_codon:yes stop_codon:yes gene_type:complete